MNLSDPNYLLIVLGLGAIILELVIGVHTGFDMLIIDLIAVFSGAFGVVVGSFPAALLAVAVLSIIYVIFGRSMVKKALNIKPTATNVERVLGCKAHVVKAISKTKAGQVKIDTEVWRAEAGKSIEVGEEVIVKSVSGVTLQVE